MNMSRRAFLASSAAVVLAACNDDGSSPTTPPPTTVAASTTPPATTAPSASTTAVPATTTTEGVTTSTRPGPVDYDGATNPFTLGVASGDPLASSVILWTRLAPDPLNGGGLAEVPHYVSYEVALDDQFEQLVGRDVAVALPEDGHSVHVDVQHLEVDTWFFYRFTAGSHTSPVGRTRTCPAPRTTPARFALGAATCQNFEDGFYAAHRDIATAGLDAVVFLGDYIYEYAARKVQGAVVRSHGTAEPTDLGAYRNRYALYKTDPDLQAAHAACPWYVIWDDHEVENNYAGLQSEDAAISPEDFRSRRNAAYQAWWEHQPVRLPAPRGATDFQVYRQLWVGKLLELNLLDERQYRSDQSCGDATFQLAPACKETFDPTRTMLGAKQEAWFAEAIGSTGAIWTAVANEVILGDVTINGAVLNYDQWDGYPAARDRLLQAVVDAKIANLVVLTGDIHFAGVGNLRGPATTADRPIIGAEFVTTSISSAGLVDPSAGLLPSLFPDIVDIDLAHRGWTKHIVTPTTWTAEYRIVDDVKRRDSKVTASKTFTVKAGSPGIASHT
jgi:alkaline phosphatase D